MRRFFVFRKLLPMLGFVFVMGLPLQGQTTEKEAISGIWQGQPFKAKKGVNGPMAPLPQVNIFLWKGTLNVLSKLPLDQADPFSGVVSSQWFILPKFPASRFKVQVLVLGKN